METKKIREFGAKADSFVRNLSAKVTQIRSPLVTNEDDLPKARVDRSIYRVAVLTVFLSGILLKAPDVRRRKVNWEALTLELP